MRYCSQYSNLLDFRYDSYQLTLEDIQKHKMTTNNKKGQYELHNRDAVKTKQLKIT